MRRVAPFVLMVLLLGVSVPAQAAGSFRILCSTYPLWLLARNVARDAPGVEVGLLLPPGLGCPHDYVMTPEDMRRLATADVLAVNGLGLDDFLKKPLAKANPKAAVLDSSRGLDGLLADEGREPGDGHGDGHGHGHGHGRFNPHLFASPAMAARLVRNLAAMLAAVRPEASEVFRRNAEAQALRLEDLAERFRAAVRTLANPRIVTEHEVFDYLARDAGLTVSAVIQARPGQDPSAAEMLALVRKIRASGAGAVFTEPQYPARLALVLAAEANVPAAVLDPVANGPADPAPDYYERVMEANLQTLVRVLGKK